MPREEIRKGALREGRSNTRDVNPALCQDCSASGAVCGDLAEVGRSSFFARRQRMKPYSDGDRQLALRP